MSTDFREDYKIGTLIWINDAHGLGMGLYRVTEIENPGVRVTLRRLIGEPETIEIKPSYWELDSLRRARRAWKIMVEEVLR
jgi:hypothetical protein